MKRDEAGQVAGLEGLVFGVLVFVFGTLLVVNAWAVVDSASAASAAARAAARTYVEGGDGERAGLEAFAAHGRAWRERASVRRVAGTYTRCARVTFEAAYRLPALTVPVLGGLGDGVRVRARHSEVVDPYRSGLPAHGRDCAAR